MTYLSRALRLIDTAGRVMRSSFAGSYMLRGAALALGVGVNVLLARLLGPAEFGAYILALTVMTLLAVPVFSGIATLMIREVSRAAATQAWGRLHGGLRAANLAVLVMVAVVALLAMLAVRLHGAPQNASLWLWALLLLPLYCLANLRGAVLCGLQRPVLGQLPDTILRPVALALALLLLSGTARITASSAMALHVAAASVAFVIGTLLLLRLLPKQVREASPEYHPRIWLRSVVPFTLIVGIQIVNSSLSVLLLGQFGSHADIGLYRIADLGASLVAMGLVAADIVFAPRIAALHVSGNHLALQRQTTRMTRIMLGAALPLALLMTVFGEPLIRLLFGATFVGARWPLFVLSLGQLVNVGTGAVGSLLTMTGHEREAMRAVATATMLNLLLGAGLIPYWGPLGAAFASASTLVTLNLFLQWRVKRVLGIRSSPW